MGAAVVIRVMELFGFLRAGASSKTINRGFSLLCVAGRTGKLAAADAAADPGTVTRGEASTAPAPGTLVTVASVGFAVAVVYLHFGLAAVA